MVIRSRGIGFILISLPICKLLRKYRLPTLFLQDFYIFFFFFYIQYCHTIITTLRAFLIGFCVTSKRVFKSKNTYGGDFYAFKIPCFFLFFYLSMSKRDFYRECCPDCQRSPGTVSGSKFRTKRCIPCVCSIEIIAASRENASSSLNFCNPVKNNNRRDPMFGYLDSTESNTLTSRRGVNNFEHFFSNFDFFFFGLKSFKHSIIQ